jgi:Na+-translocating ferredoxin:NAD+ oxidoreductase subunit C
VLKTFPKGGIHPAGNKISENNAIKVLPIPKVVFVPLAQHLGTPATPLVKAGDNVLTGQLIARAEGFISSNIHSPVSGTVKKIDSIIDYSGYKQNAIIIESEGDEWVETIDRSPGMKVGINFSPEEIISKIAEAGIVGMGGATFPTQVKLMFPAEKKADYLVINGAECEPYLTCDYRIMLEKGEELMIGTHILMKALEVEKAIIGIENNKPDAIRHLTAIAQKHLGIYIQPLKTKYPQGGERQLIKSLLNKEVPSGGLPIDIGAVVFNISTVYAVYEAVQKNKPLIERVVTVTGKSLNKPSNFRVRLGTPVSELILAAGGTPEDTGKIINGGPLMGRALFTTDIPIIKGCSGILILPEKESKRKQIQTCIRCAKCVSVCCTGLQPYLLMALTEKSMYEKLESENITDCIECGSCSYICPACRPLLDFIRLGKSIVIKNKRLRKQ